MAMAKQSMKDKIKAAYNTRTGLNMTEGDFNVIIDVCQGIIEEIIANAVVEVTVSGVQTGPSSIVATGSVIN